MSKKYFYLSYSLLLVLIIAGCADSITESTPSIDQENDNVELGTTFSEIQKNIFDQSCAFSGCHVSGSVNPDLSGNSHSKIVNVPSSTGMLLIKPNDPDNSYLLKKIVGGSINGSRMPLNSSPLSQEKVDALIEWINNGAQNN